MERIEQEKLIVAKMIGIYCNKHHSTQRKKLCKECQLLLDYADKRINKCPKGDKKSSCRKCEIHCYKPEYRQKIREVMRYVGPRMIFIDPISAIKHIMSELK